jgi:hypothetical protein
MAKRAPPRPPDRPPGGPNSPYVDWAWNEGFPYYFLPGLQETDKERMPLLLQLRGISAEEFVHGAFIEGEERQQEWQASFLIPFPDAEGLAPPGDASWVVAMATKEISDTIAEAREVSRYVETVILGRPLDTQSLPPLKPKPKLKSKPQPTIRTTGGNPPAVVMGIIDDGIAFANDRFRILGGADAGTRVQNWWLMDGPANNFLGGHMLDKAAIDTLLVDCTDANGVLNEEKFYRKVELLDFRQPNHKSAALRVAHGTHVMDTACGFDPADQRTDRPIVCVQLPTRVTAAVDNGSLLPFFVLALGYIISSARDIAQKWNVPPLPVVVNFSYGRLEGPHDGSHVVEQVIEAARFLCENILGFPLRVVLSAGNSYLSRIHAQLSFAAAGDAKTVNWRVLPDDRTDSFVEIWLPPPAAGAPPSRVTVTIKDPTQHSFTIDETMFSVPIGAYGRMYYWKTPTRRVFVLALKPTTDLSGALVAPVGTYEIEIRHTGGLAAGDIVHAWVARDDTLPGFPQAGRQSFFNNRDYERFDYAGRDLEIDNASLVKRESTINAIATGASPIVMGGYLGRETVLAKYSAAGSKTVQPPRRPDAATVSDDSRVHGGVLAAGTRSGSVIAMNGTSVAAPQIARRIADDLANGGLGDRAAVQALAVTPLTAVPLLQPERSGAGGILPDPIVKLKRYEFP